MAWTPDYVSVPELGRYMEISDDDDDIELAVAVTSASRAIDDHCNRQFGLVDAPEQRLYTARVDPDRCRWVIDIDDLMTTVGLVVEVTGVGIVTAYTLEPVNAAQKGRPWTRLVVDTASAVQPTGVEYELAGTGRWGWTTVPVPVTLAGRLQASRFHSRRGSPYGVAGSPSDGSEMRLLSKLDPDVAVSLRSFIRPRKVG